MLSILVSLLILCLIVAVAWWILSLIPLPPPFGMIVQVVLALIALIWVINLLLPLSGEHFFLR